MSSILIKEKIEFTKKLLDLRNYEYLRSVMSESTTTITSIQLGCDDVNLMFGDQRTVSFLLLSINDIHVGFDVFVEDIISHPTNLDITIDEFEQFLVEHDFKISPLIELLTKVIFVDSLLLLGFEEGKINIEILEDKINETKEFILKNTHLLEIS